MPTKDLLLRVTGDSSSAERALIRAEMAQRRYDNAIRSAHAEMEADLDRSSKKTIANLANVGKVMVGVGIAAGAGVVAAVNAYAKFDQAMSEVQASTHETAANMDLLRQSALDLGASTVFSATEVAAAQSELAKASVSTADILNGALAGALDLAAAGGLGVAEAAETMATALSIFNLEGDKASHVADLLAAGAGKAQGSVSDMGMALNQSAQVAAQFGFSVDETVGVLSEFAAAGLTGSDAGTSLRTMLIRLANPSAEAATAMRELGINAYDAAGNMVKPEQLAGQLQARMSDLAPATRDAALATIFGNDAIRAAGVLYGDGAQVAGDWVDKVNDTGYAAETARIKMNNLRGDLEKLRGAFETALIGLGESADAPLRSVVQNLTDLVDKFNALSPGAKTAILAVAGVTAGVGLLGGAALILLPKIVATRVALAELGVTAKGTAGALGGLAAVTAGLLIGNELGKLTDKVREATGQLPEIDKLATALKKLGESGEVSGELLNTFGGDLSGLTSRLQQGGFMQGLTGAISGMKGFNDSVGRVDEGLANLVSSGHAEEAARAFDEIAAAAQAQGMSFDEITEKFPDYVDAADAAGVGVGNLRQKMLDAADEARTGTGAYEGMGRGLEGVGDAAFNAGEKSAELAASYEAQLEVIPELNDEQAILAERLGLTAQKAIDLTDAMSELAFQQEVLTGGTVDAIKAESRYEEAVDRAQATFDDYAEAMAQAAKDGEAFADAIDEQTGSFDLNTESGRTASDSLLAIRDSALLAAEAIYEQTGNEGDYRDAVDKGRQALFDKAKQYFVTEEAAWDYVDSILAIPEERVTLASFDDAEARRLMGEFGSYVDWVTRDRTISIYGEWIPSGPLEGSGFTGEGAGGQSGRVGAPADGGRFGEQSFGERVIGGDGSSVGSFSVPAGRGGGGYTDARTFVNEHHEHMPFRKESSRDRAQRSILTAQLGAMFAGQPGGGQPIVEAR